MPKLISKALRTLAHTFFGWANSLSYAEYKFSKKFQK